MDIYRSLGVFVFTTGLVIACDGGGGSGSSSSGGAGTVDSFITQYCDLFQPCCAKANKPYDQAKCRAFYTAFSAQSTYDSTKGQACLDATRAEANQATFCDEGLSDEAGATCNGVFTKGTSSGAKKPGETCESDSECASSPEGEANCATSFSNGATTKLCQIQVRGKEGEGECVGVKDGKSTSISLSTSGPPPQRVVLCWTADGLFCDSKTKKCTKMQEAGGPCDSFDRYACAKTAYCDTTAKTCVARKAAGEDCSPTSGTSQCAEKLFCDDQTKKCAPTVPTGGTCTRSKECEKVSCTNGKCSGGSSVTTAFVCTQ